MAMTGEDLMVKEVQKWINQTYDPSLIPTLEVDGKTGQTTVRALIKALQIELDIAPVDGIMGADTMEALPTLYAGFTTEAFSVTKVVYILQGAMYCKGYNPGGFDGIYGNGVENGIIDFKTDAGLTSPDGKTEAKVFKALLNTDGFVLAADKGGTATMRTAQQQLNNKYFGSEVMDLIPTWGIYDRTTNRALIKSIQIESNLAPDGVWGPNTMNACPTLRRYGTVTNRQFVYILQYALYANGFDPNGFDGAFGAGMETAVKNFQTFVGLDDDGVAGKQTWASLLVSYGDKNRKGKACDCSTILDNAKIQTLKADGREVVGRYIAGGSWKRLTAGELNLILNGGLKLFPIFQTSGNVLEYFNYTQGCLDGREAIANASELKLPKNTAIYFAVDVDAYDIDVKGRIKKYFMGIHDIFTSEANTPYCYKAGVYGSRNVCITMSDAGYTEGSFVSDMSSGFSGNIGFRLPQDWVYDQISTVSLGTGTGLITIDNNILKRSFYEVTSVDSELLSGLNLAQLDRLLLDDVDFRQMVTYGYWYIHYTESGDYAIADAFYVYMRMLRRQEKYRNKYVGYMDSNGYYDETYTYADIEETAKYELQITSNGRFTAEEIQAMHQYDTVVEAVIALIPVVGGGLSDFIGYLNDLQQGEEIYTVVIDMANDIRTEVISSILEEITQRGAEYLAKIGLILDVIELGQTVLYPQEDEETYYYKYVGEEKYRIEPYDTYVECLMTYHIEAELKEYTEHILYTHKDYPVVSRCFKLTSV